jgi:hypothetical protein
MNEHPIAPPVLASGAATRPERIVYPESPRYRRIRTISTLMDQSIVLPTGYRIGLDPLLGLLPGVGDVVSALISLYLVYEAARLGLRKRILAQMIGNIGIDTLVGSFPVLGDVFDAAWKSNMRNLRLLDRHYHPALPERSAGRIRAWMLGIAFLLVGAVGTMSYLSAQFILAFWTAFTRFLGL